MVVKSIKHDRLQLLRSLFFQLNITSRYVVSDAYFLATAQIKFRSITTNIITRRKRIYTVNILTGSSFINRNPFPGLFLQCK